MSHTSLLLFLTLVLAVTAAVHTFLYRRFVVGWGIRAPRFRWPLRALAALLAVSYPLTRWLDGWAPDVVVKGAHWTAALWTGLMFHLLWIGLVLWLFKGVFWSTGLWQRWTAHHEVLGRLAVGGTIAGALLLSGFGLVGARQEARIRLVQVPAKGITPEIRAWKIVVLSDLHAGVLVDGEEVRKRVDEVLELEPDLILLPGDVLDHPPRRLGGVARELSRLRAPLGVFATTGNHEYYIGVEDALVLLKSAGIRVLTNERVELPGGLILAGTEDRTADSFGRGRPSPAGILGSDAKSRPAIFLHHTPVPAEAEAAVEAGADLCVSGHTHAGQIWPFKYLSRLASRYQHGLYPVGDGWQLTTCGIGWWGPPMRLAAPPEILLIRLVAEGEKAWIE